MDARGEQDVQNTAGREIFSSVAIRPPRDSVFLRGGLILSKARNEIRTVFFA
jgi:hypothetical protein